MRIMHASTVKAWLITGMLIALLAPSPTHADSIPKTVSLDVPRGQWKGVRFKDLPKDIVLTLGMTVNGGISVGFLTASDHRQFPHMTQPLFWGQAEAKLGFSVTIQQPGDYYVVLDNRDGSNGRRVNLTLKATATNAAAQALMAEQLRKIELQLKTLEQKLNQMFIFNPRPIRVKTCEGQQPFERTETLTLCLQYARQLMQTFQDRTQATDALMYSLFQEVAQVFQSQWGLEATDSADTLDELTTVLMLTFRLDANVRAYSQTIINQPALSVTLEKAFKDSLHPLNTERAQRVLGWATNPNLVRSWQPHLVPHMQTSVLQQLKAHPQPWSDIELIEQELATRDRLPRPKEKIKA
jgi:hypothetical protein